MGVIRSRTALSRITGHEHGTSGERRPQRSPAAFGPRGLLGPGQQANLHQDEVIDRKAEPPAELEDLVPEAEGPGVAEGVPAFAESRGR
jgi:hypothetical protein